MHMNPLAWPVLILAALTFWIGVRSEKALKRRPARVGFLILAGVLAIPGLLFVFYYTHLFDNAAWFYEFRTLRFTELLVSGMGLGAGFLYSLIQPESLGERLAIPATLFVLVAIPFIKPLITPLDFEQLKDQCDGDVCLQSTPSTCGPASAANILKGFGESASERKLAEEAFSYRGGTENWYLARALRRHGYDTSVLISSPLPQVIPTPSIAGVLVGGGAGHFIAVMSQDESGVTLVDPLKGRIVIPRANVEKQYHFTGFLLVVRKR